MRLGCGRLIGIAGSMALLAACSLAGPAVEPEQAETPTREVELTEVAAEVTDEPTPTTAVTTGGEPLFILEDNWPVSQSQPGDTLALSVGVQVCCVYYEQVDAPASWSVEPGDAASI